MYDAMRAGAGFMLVWALCSFSSGCTASKGSDGLVNDAGLAIDGSLVADASAGVDSSALYDGPPHHDSSVNPKDAGGDGARSHDGGDASVASDGGADASGPRPFCPIPANIIPFANYTLDDNYLAIETPGDGGVLKIVTMATSAHFNPHTGHLYGKEGPDFKGLYAARWSDMVKLEGLDGGTVCQPHDVCGVPKESIDRRPARYAAPFDGLLIDQVTLGNYGGSPYYEFGDDWFIHGAWCDGRYEFTWGHVRKIAPGLRAKLLGRGYADPWQCSSDCGPDGGCINCLGLNLINTDGGILLAQGDDVGDAQIQAVELVDHPGYYFGASEIKSPMAQIEFGMRVFLDGEPGGTRHLWASFLSDADQRHLEQVLFNEAARSDSVIFAQCSLDWQWKAEMKFLRMASYQDGESSSIFSPMGAWLESASVPPAADNCSSPVEGCNEGLTLVRIIKDGNPFYSPDAGLYDSADVSYLAVKTRYGEQPTEGEVIEPASPDATSGYMIFKWREQGYSSLSPPVYQGIKYRLDTSIGWLKIAWTISNIDRAVVDNAMIGLPQPQAGTACSDPVKCYRTPAGGLNFGYRGYN